MLKKPLHFFAIFIATFLISSYSFSQCYFTGNSYQRCTDGKMTIVDCKIHNGTFTNPYPPHEPLLLKLGTHCGNTTGGGSTEFYSLDLRHNVVNQDYSDSGVNVTDIKMLYVLYHYEEYNHSAPGALSIDEEVAAVQIALHHFDEGLNLNTMDTVAPGAAAKKRIHTRAWFIVNDANANATPRTVITPIQFIPGANPDDFRVKVVDMDGNPQGGITVNLCLSDSAASLNDYSKVTNGTTGLTGIFTVSGAATSVIIGAKAIQCKLPCGRIFVSPTTTGAKKLVLTGNVADNFLRGDFCDEISFGVLPVELASFIANVSGRNINLNWRTMAENNNSGFEIYRTSIGSDRWEKIGFVTGHGTSNQPHEYTYADRNLSSGRFTYRIKQVDFNGNFKWYPLGTELGIGVPAKFELSQNYPNPFNPSTTINYDLPHDEFVKIKIFDISGKEVASLVNANVSAGYHTVTFDAAKLSSGIYYYKLETSSFTKVQKMALVK